MVRWPSLVGVLGVLGAGCPRSAPPTTLVAPNEPPREEEAEWGARRGGAAWGSAFAVEGEGVTIELPAVQASCATFAVRAGRGLRDVDLSVHDLDGRVVALDQAPDAHALVEVCGGEPRFARARVVAGAGRLSWVWLEGEGTALRGELGIAGGRAVVDAWFELDRGLVGRGFTLRSERWSAVAEPGPPLLLPFRVEPGRCVTFAARAEAPIVLSLVDERGLRVQGDGERSSALQLCSGDEARTGRLELRASAAGEIAFARWEGREADVGGDEALWFGRRE